MTEGSSNGEKKIMRCYTVGRTFIQQLRGVWPMPTLRVSLLGNAKTPHCSFCFPTPVPQQHLRNLPGIVTQRHRGRDPICKPGNTSEGEERLQNELRINGCCTLWRYLSLNGPTMISALAHRDEVNSGSENSLLTNNITSWQCWTLTQRSPKWR